jgi:uncharacterized membrane protein
MSIPADPPGDGSHQQVDSIVIARSRSELYAFWRDFTNVPKFMENVQTVTEVDALSSLWTVKDAAGNAAQWELLITEDEPDRLIAWSTSGNSPVRYSGSIEFKDFPYRDVATGGEYPAGSAGPGSPTGTQVTATVRYALPSGLIENLEHFVARVAGSGTAVQEPVVQTRADLMRFKQLMENRGNGGPAPGANPPPS